jgi:hypothetical protein
LLAQAIIEQQKHINDFLEWNHIKVLRKDEKMIEKKVEMILKKVTKIENSGSFQEISQDLEQKFVKLN